MNSEKAGKIPEPEPAMLPAIPLPPSLPRHFPEKRQFQGIPSVAVTGAGGIYAVWYTGGEHEGPGNFCVVARGDDDGQNWRDPLLVVEHPHPNVRAFDPNLWVAPDGALWLFWAQSYSIQRGNTGDGRIGVWAARCAEPDAEAPVFESPVRIANGVMMNKPLVLSNGEWAFPTACWNDLTEHGALPVWPEFRHQKLSNITISPDSGKTFFWRGGADVPERCYDEHHILELKDGRLWMLVRTNYGIGQSFSIDKGRTWTPGEKTSFRSPNSRFFIRRLRSGRILLINNDDDSGLDYHQHPWRPRRNLTACLSGDDGKTWSDGLPLDSRGVAYPDAFEDMKGWIHVVFDMDRLKGGPILYSRLTEDDILAGRLVSKGSVSSRIISSFPYQENGREPGAEK